jgi:hypothetical protein
MQQLIILLTLFSVNAFSQNLKSKLQGDWVCTKILDTNGNNASGKFGKSDEYLKFSFVKGKLSITEAPFDTGIMMPIEYGGDYIDLFPDAQYELPERKYKVGFVSSDSLVLVTKNADNENIFYHFINQARFLKEISPDQKTVTEGLIIIQHLRMQKDPKATNRLSVYQISNEPDNLYPSPRFEDYASATFGQYFTINFTFPKTYRPDTLLNELIVDFDVTNGGVKNINIIQGINQEINSSVIKIIEKTRKKWKPIEVNGQAVNTTMLLHFVFFLGTQKPIFKFTN